MTLSRTDGPDDRSGRPSGYRVPLARPKPAAVRAREARPVRPGSSGWGLLGILLILTALAVYALGEWLWHNHTASGLIVAPVAIAVDLPGAAPQDLGRAPLRPRRPAAHLDRAPAAVHLPPVRLGHRCRRLQPRRRPPGRQLPRPALHLGRRRRRGLGARHRQPPLHHRPGPRPDRLQLLRHHPAVRLHGLRRVLAVLPGLRDRRARRRPLPLRQAHLPVAVVALLAVEHRQGQLDAVDHRAGLVRRRPAAHPQPGRLPADRRRPGRQRPRPTPRHAAGLRRHRHRLPDRPPRRPPHPGPGQPGRHHQGRSASS